ncbi:hypothetical protein [Pokkaliibacter plantistimulans]|uniref:hypothetical protein n=1 Tax=Pokkaliibacter plantistimulans TaxID=1635171 RepID=UPI003990321F
MRRSNPASPLCIQPSAPGPLFILPSCHPAILPSCHPAILPSCHPAILPSCHPAILPVIFLLTRNHTSHSSV